MTSEKPVRIAAGLYGARETARDMLGAKFNEHMAKYGEAITGLSKANGISLAVAATILAKDMAENVSGAAAVTALAAYVELIEPTK